MSDAMRRNDEALWTEFVAGARTLIATAPEHMSTEQLDRLEAVSDALIHLVGYVQARKPFSPTERDLRLVDELARREKRTRRRPASQVDASPDVILSDDERRSLRQRIISGLQSERLRVREAQSPPCKRPLDGGRRVLRADLLREVQGAHRAVMVSELSIAAGAGRELWDVECDTTIDVPDDLPRAPYLALEVRGDSMEPLLHSGDTILVKVDDKAVTGTVVVARDPDHGYVVKEVGRLTMDGIELESVNPEFPTLRVPHMAGAVLGTVLLKWCPHAERRQRPSGVTG